MNTDLQNQPVILDQLEELVTLPQPEESASGEAPWAPASIPWIIPSLS